MVGPVAAAAALHVTAAEMAAMPAHTVPVEADGVVALDRHRVAFEPAHRRAGVEVCFSERRLQPGITMDMSSKQRDHQARGDGGHGALIPVAAHRRPRALRTYCVFRTNVTVRFGDVTDADSELTYSVS